MKKKVLYRLIVLILFIIFSLLSYYFFLSKYFDLKTIQQNSAFLKRIVDNYYLEIVLVYILGCTIIAILPIAGESFFSVTGGFLFNFWPGILYACLGTTLGAYISFLSTRLFVGQEMQKHYLDEIKFLNQQIKHNGKYYLLFLRFVPFIPFFLINYLSGFTKISTATFLVTTLIGILPITSIYVYTGEFLNKIRTINDFFSYKVYLILTGLAVLSLLPVIVRKFLKNK
ncbi:VTT domain-containing protein [Candidatus Dependentiae bacterium]|nr:VTT domain-containing protein [Candidatus Dependentiae bacterium]